ncbi:circularly permuted type 2 ATP-grasp protein [Candidatus Magnetaquicoccus inordinatus]|uniref:circularly permuted type 2 ATP-grasp protein n=1 Tax=Candidatus Magnetaquicoccus inordinatus TaxID=2496818 RepID=UPI00187D2D9B|nr:circularly permuted type 2 ATP-grasp protein [Candidatus Magnetaquicoccus inordinatus]
MNQNLIASSRWQLLRDYTPPPGYDEILLANGEVRPDWSMLLNHLNQLGEQRLESLRQQARHLLRENGLTFNLFQSENGDSRAWDLDLLPLLLAEQEWLNLEQGLKQRHRVLEMLLADLYGKQETLRHGIIPPTLLFSDPGYLRACHGLPHPRGALLPWWAVDLVRTPQGSFQVVGDLLQTPSGAGYALENRQILFRLLRQPLNENRVRLLLPFFSALRTHLNDASPLLKEDPQIVLLTPGPGEKIYFEHAFLANYLGLTLVQGEDLTVRTGRLHIKTLDGLHPVDVVWRMLNDLQCDPLELNESGFLGVAGLVQAVQGERAAVINHPGAAVLENRALLGYFPAICQHFLGESPRLAVTSTRWCGDPVARAEILDTPEQWLLQHRSHPSRPTINPRTLTREQLQKEIQNYPHEWIATPPIVPSTLPVMTAMGVRPGHVILRTFATAGRLGVEVMPGGLARMITEPEQIHTFDDPSGITKDVWVISHNQVVTRTNRMPMERLSEPSIFSGDISSRMAENLFWAGRYAERGEYTLRLLRMLLLLPRPEGNEQGENAELDAMRLLYSALTQVTASEPGFTGEGAEQRFCNPEEEFRSLIVAQDRPGSLYSSIRALLLAAHRVRERLSNDTWRVLNQLMALHQSLGRHKLTADMVGEMESLITAFAALAGLAQENMTRGLGWRFLDLGRRVERAIYQVELLRATLIRPLSAEGERFLLDALLSISDSSITYRRRYRTHLAIKPFLELILLDETNPRSLASQLALMNEHVAALPYRRPTPPHRTPCGRIAMESFSALRMAEPDLLGMVGEAGEYSNLAALLERFQGLLPLFSLELAHTFFQHSSSRSLGGGAREL